MQIMVFLPVLLSSWWILFPFNKAADIKNSITNDVAPYTTLIDPPPWAAFLWNLHKQSAHTSILRHSPSSMAGASIIIKPTYPAVIVPRTWLSPTCRSPVRMLQAQLLFIQYLLSSLGSLFCSSVLWLALSQAQPYSVL